MTPMKRRRIPRKVRSLEVSEGTWPSVGTEAASLSFEVVVVEEAVEGRSVVGVDVGAAESPLMELAADLKDAPSVSEPAPVVSAFLSLPKAMLGCVVVLCCVL